MNTKGTDGQKKDSREKHQGAVEMANIRWGKTTAAERKAHVQKMVRARLKAQAKTKAAKKKAAQKRVKVRSK